MDGAEVDEIVAGAGFGVEALDVGGEEVEVDAAAEVPRTSRRALRKRSTLVSCFGVESGVAAEGAPGAFDPAWRSAHAAALLEGGFEDGEGAVEEVLTFGAEEIAARGDDGGEAIRWQGSGWAAVGDGEEVGEAEAAPRGVEDGEPGDAVGGVEERAGEGEGVEDFGALAELFDVERRGRGWFGRRRRGG